MYKLLFATKSTQANKVYSSLNFDDKHRSVAPLVENRDSTDGRHEENLSREGDASVTAIITKESINERVGIAFRTSLLSDSLYVYNIESNSKFLDTDLKEGMKVLSINGIVCPKALPEAIRMLRNARDLLSIEACPNDESKYEDHNDMVTLLDADLNEIAVEEFSRDCGIFEVIRLGVCVGALPAATTQKKTPLKNEKDEKKELIEEKEKETIQEEITESIEVDLNAIIKERRLTFRLAKEIRQLGMTIKASFQQWAPKINPKAKFQQWPQKMAMNTMFQKWPRKMTMKTLLQQWPQRLSINTKYHQWPKKEGSESREVVLRECEESANVNSEEKDVGGVVSTTVRISKSAHDEPIGLAIRNSTVTKGIYIYGIFGSSKLQKSNLSEGMRIISINGKTFKSCDEVIKTLKSSITLEIRAIPNDES